MVRIHEIPLVRPYDVSCKSSNGTPINVAVVHPHHVSELRCRDALLVELFYVFKLLCHDLHLVGFHVSFKPQIKYQKGGKQEQ